MHARKATKKLSICPQIKWQAKHVRKPTNLLQLDRYFVRAQLTKISSENSGLLALHAFQQDSKLNI